MSDILVPDADGIKLLRDGGPEALLGNPKLGDKPIPHRKRAFYRAWRRHELTAVVPYVAYQTICASNMFAAVHADPNCPSDQIYIYWSNE